MARLGIPTQPAGAEVVRTIEASLAGATRQRIRSSISALKFTSTGHVTDPLEVVRALLDAARQRGAEFLRAEAHLLETHPDRIDVHTSDGTRSVDSVVIAAGAWSASLLEPFGLTVPMEAVRGYHVDLAGQSPVVDAPILYSDTRILVTPMSGRLRACSYMDFVEPNAPPDPRKTERLIERLGRVGYDCSTAGNPWWGPRPVLPDYLPGIGCVPGTKVFYAIGHQHLGLTLAAVTADLVADLVAGNRPRHDVSPFDIKRFGASPQVLPILSLP
jgi:D-amino-acid dehydrogenase